MGDLGTPARSPLRTLPAPRVSQSLLCCWKCPVPSPGPKLLLPESGGPSLSLFPRKA